MDATSLFVEKIINGLDGSLSNGELEGPRIFRITALAFAWHLTLRLREENSSHSHDSVCWSYVWMCIVHVLDEVCF